MPDVSLIIPSYNHAETLTRAVVSGLAQSALKEVIVVDDHSADDSLKIAQELAKKDVRVRVIQTPINIGPGGARNAGVRAASGNYICFLDADDELLAGFFDEALAMLATQEGMRVIKGEMEFFDPVKGYILPIFDPRHKSAVLSSACGMVMERGLFLSISGFPEDHVFRGPSGGEDVAFMQAVMEHCQPIGRIDRPCYKVWSQAGSHVDRFLASTRLKGESFEFVFIHPDQTPDGLLAQAIKKYLSLVHDRLGENNL